MAGLVSSIYLSSKGLKTAVVSKGDPVCSISSGCIDLAGDFSQIPSDHPYNKAGKEKISKAFSYFKEIMTEAGLPYEGEVFKNRFIYSPIARKRETCLVPHSMIEAHNNKDKTLHIISFKKIKDFFPGYFTKKFADAGCSIYEGAAKTTIGIATQFDDPQFRDIFYSWLKDQNIKEDLLAIPAILGTSNPQRIIDDIEELTGKKIFEIPTLPPSMPGLRLFRSLKSLAVKKGVHFFWGHAISDFEKSDENISKLIIDQPGRPTIIEGKSFLLATGSFVSGGLFAEKTSIRETVFNIPVVIPEGEQRLNDSFFDPDHPLGKAGIKVTENYKPANGKAGNLFIGGSILEDSQIMKYQCGHGLALVTGLEAARSCEEYLK